MTRQKAISILAAHGMRYRIDGEWLEVCEEYTLRDDPNVYREWIRCPGTESALFDWLGY